MGDVHEESSYTYVEMRDKVVPDLPDNSVKEHLSIVNCGHDVGSGRSAMEGQNKTSTYTYVDMRDKVIPDLPDNSGKEHLSIVNCGHDVGSGRSAMEGQNKTSTYTYVDMRDKVIPDLPDNSGKENLSIVNCGHDVSSGMGTDGELTQRVVEKSRPNSTSNNEIDLWMKVYEQDYPSILKLHHYFLETWSTITIELVNPSIATVGIDSRSVASERTIFVVVKELGSMQGVIDQGQTIRVLLVFPTRMFKMDCCKKHQYRNARARQNTKKSSKQ